MKSRPVYPGLSPRPGVLHIIVSDENGAAAVAALVAKAPTEFWRRAQVLYAPASPAHTPAETAASQSALDGLRATGAQSVHRSPSLSAILPRLDHLLQQAAMGTNLYAAGSEALIGQATKLALDAGMELECIVTEHRGTLARRVQCVHCKGITENVTTQPAACAHCGITLLVRDHYSRRIAAFQGVCIDAEEPGAAPPPMEAFK